MLQRDGCDPDIIARNAPAFHESFRFLWETLTAAK